MWPCGLVYAIVLARMWTRGLVRPLFVAKTTWFGIPNFCDVEEEWVELGVEDHEVRDGKSMNDELSGVN